MIRNLNFYVSNKCHLDTHVLHLSDQKTIAKHDIHHFYVQYDAHFTHYRNLKDVDSMYSKLLLKGLHFTAQSFSSSDEPSMWYIRIHVGL